MKQCITLFALLLTLGTVSLMAQDLDSGLVVYYNFEGNLTDSISGTDAPSNGNLTYTDPGEGKVGSQAIRYFTNDSYFKTPAMALIPGRAEVGGTPASFAMWVNHRDVPLGVERQNYLAQEDACEETGRVTLYLQGPGGAKGDTIVSFVGNARSSSEFSPVMRPGEWIHLALTIDPETRLFNFYVDGVLTNQDSLTGGKQVEPSCGQYIVGHHKADGTETQTFDGLMDDLRFYNRVLTPVEVGLLAGIDVTSTREVLTAAALKLTPNPASPNQAVTVGIDNKVFAIGSTVDLRVIDATGRIIISKSYEGVRDQVQLDHRLVPGVYTLSLTNGKRIAASQLVVR